MAESSQNENSDGGQPITLILNRIQAGESGATQELFESLYAQLRRLAQVKMAQEKPGHTLQATALVNEAFLRLVGPSDTTWENRNHFFAAAAEAMRRILVEMARQKKSLKRGGGWQKLELADEEVVESPIAEELLDLDEALKRFEMVDPIKAKLVKLRFFAGMTNAEAAGALGIGLSTAERYWTFAKAWLHQEVKR